MITQLPNYWFVADAMPLPLFDMLLLVLNSASRIPAYPAYRQAHSAFRYGQLLYG
jgi:hypothetical protein